MKHDTKDRISLDIARRIASGLPHHPEWIQLAQDNLDRWERLNGDSPSLLRCYSEWRTILKKPNVEVCALLIAQTDDGQRLRQNSPFVGVLSPIEIWEIKGLIHESSAA